MTARISHDKILSLEEALKLIEHLMKEDESIANVELRRTRRGFVVLRVDKQVMTGE